MTFPDVPSKKRGLELTGRHAAAAQIAGERLQRHASAQQRADGRQRGKKSTDSAGFGATGARGRRLIWVTAPRQVLPGRTYLITRRCLQRQFLLRPDERTNRIFLYCLSEALLRYGIELNVLLAMSNHYHLVIFDGHGRLPQFLRHLNLMTAKALNVRWGRWENLWSVEQASATWLVEDEDVLAKGVYALVNPSVDDLVEHVADWPGASSWSAHVSGKTIVIERPREFFRKRGAMPERVELKVVAPRRAANPEERWPLAEWNERLLCAVRSAEDTALAWRRKRGVSVLGRGNVRRQSAFDSPKTYTRRRTLRPSVACRSRDRRIHELAILRVFRQLHRLASQAFLNGGRAVVFPAGSWAQRAFCAAPPAPE